MAMSGAARTSPILLQQLPNGRNLWPPLRGQEPFTVTNRFEIGRTKTALPVRFSAFGASWAENRYRLNGMDVTDAPSSLTAIKIGKRQWTWIIVLSYQ